MRVINDFRLWLASECGIADNPHDSLNAKPVSDRVPDPLMRCHSFDRGPLTEGIRERGDRYFYPVWLSQAFTGFLSSTLGH